jgi:diaminopimelate decarboxylase
MSHFSYQDGVLHAESTPLSKIAEEFGTPAYVYSKAALLENFAAPTPTPARAVTPWSATR